MKSLAETHSGHLYQSQEETDGPVKVLTPHLELSVGCYHKALVMLQGAKAALESVGSTAVHKTPLSQVSSGSGSVMVGRGEEQVGWKAGIFIPASWWDKTGTCEVKLG